MGLIRRAQVLDAAAIGDVLVETWRNTYAGTLPSSVLVRMQPWKQRRVWESALRAGEPVLVIEDQEAGVVGFASYGANRKRDLTYAGEVNTLYILPDFQGHGLGRRLLAGAFEALVEEGHLSAVIWVLALNPSRFFYEAMGGKRIAGRDETLWGEVLHEYAYGWEDLSEALTRPRFRGT